MYNPDGLHVALGPQAAHLCRSPCSRIAPTRVNVRLSKDCRSGLCLYVVLLAVY